jgi:hypothetical protein
LGDALTVAFAAGWNAHARRVQDLAEADAEARALYDALMARIGQAA